MDDPFPMEVFDGTDEINDLKALQFSTEAISDIARKRTRHESKLTWRSLENYLEYIETENRLLALVSCKDMFPEAKKKMKARLIKKINKLYQEALGEYKNDYELMLKYFKFCSQVKAKIRANQIIGVILEKYPEKEEAWPLAISWYIENHSPENKIRETILTALAKHPSSKEIYSEAFSFELKNMQNSFTLLGRIDEGHLETTKDYIDLFFNNVHRDVDYLFEVLEKFDKCENVNSARDYFLQKIKDTCKEDPAVWENLVKRQNPNSQSNEQVLQCIAIYEEGLSVVPENNKTHLWSLYLKFLLGVLVDKEVEEGALEKHEIRVVYEKFEKAHSERHLPEDFYFFWLQLDQKLKTIYMFDRILMNETNNTTNSTDLEIYRKGLQAYPESIKLWQNYLTAYIDHDRNSEEIPKIFEKAITTLKENSVELWKMFIDYCLVLKEKDYIDSIYEKAMHDPHIAPALASKYLIWIYTNRGMEKCRDVYREFIKQHRPSKDVFSVMLRFEFFEFDGNCEDWEEVYKCALEHFPHDIDIWVDYMQFHMKFKRSSEETINAWYAKAVAALPDSLQYLLRQSISPDEL